MPRRYNPYYQQIARPYQNQSQDLVYNPQDNSAMIDRYADLLNQRQQGYDAARAGMTQFQGQVGGMQTYAPDMLQGRLDEFSASAEEMVDTQYGGDWGAARHDLLKKISQEKANPLYKAIGRQNEQAKIFQKAQSQRLKPGERFLGLQDPRQADLQAAIDSGDYSSLESNYLIAPNRDELAADIVKRTPADKITSLLADLPEADRQRLQKVYGEQGAEGLFRTLSVTGNKEKLRELIPQFSQSLYQQDSETLEAEIRLDNPGLPEETVKQLAKNKAKSIVENVVPQFGFSREDERLVDMQPKGGTATVPEVKSPIYFGGYKNASSNRYSEAVETYGKEEGQIDLTNMPNLETFKAEDENIAKQLNDIQANISKLRPIDMNTDYAKSLVAMKQNLQAEKSKIDEISDFKIDNKDIYTAIKDHEKLYGNITKIDARGNEVVVDDINEKAHIIADLADKRVNKEGRFLAFDDETLVNKLQAKWEKGRMGDVYSMQGFEPNGDVKYEKQDPGSVDVKGKWFNYSNREDLNILGINAREGRIVVQDKKGRKAEVYPSENAKYFATQNKKVYDNLDKNGYSADFDVYSGGKSLTVRIHNPRRATNNKYGAISEYTIQVPQDKAYLLNTISNKQDALNVFGQLDDAGIQSYPTESLIRNKMYEYAGGLGFTQEGSIAK